MVLMSTESVAQYLAHSRCSVRVSQQYPTEALPSLTCCHPSGTMPFSKDVDTYFPANYILQLIHLNKRQGFEVKQAEVKVWLCYFLLAQVWVTFLTFLRLNTPPKRHCCEAKRNHATKRSAPRKQYCYYYNQ